MSLILAAALWLQDPAPPDTTPAKPAAGDTMGRLYKLVAKQEKGEVFLTCNAHVSKTPKYGGNTVESQVKLLMRMVKTEDGERAVLWDETERPPEARPVPIKTLVKEQEATIWYPDDKTAFVYDLTKDGNLPWQWIFWRGLHPEMEQDYKVTVIKDPDEKGLVVEPKDKPPTESSGSGAGLLDGVRGNSLSAIDMRSLKVYILDLEPKKPRQKKQTALFTLFIDPETVRITMIQYEDQAERVDVTLSDWKAVSDIPKETFEFDLTRGVKVRNR